MEGQGLPFVPSRPSRNHFSYLLAVGSFRELFLREKWEISRPFLLNFTKDLMLMRCPLIKDKCFIITVSRKESQNSACAENFLISVHISSCAETFIIFHGLFTFLDLLSQRKKQVSFHHICWREGCNNLDCFKWSRGKTDVIHLPGITSNKPFSAHLQSENDYSNSKCTSTDTTDSLHSPQNQAYWCHIFLLHSYLVHRECHDQMQYFYLLFHLLMP